MVESEVNEKSEFNDALGYLRRINACLYSADMSSMELNYYGWFHALMAFRRELSTEIGEALLTDFNELISKINNEIYSVTSSNGRIKYSIKIYENLDSFEIRLRKIYKSSGLQMRMQSDASKALFRS
jgi:hypothetical protein